MTKRLRKWRHVRVSLKTHQMLSDMRAHTDIPMAEFVERLVAHIYGGGIMSMTALTFFVIYMDGKPQYVVAAKDAAHAEQGMRTQVLGQGVKTIKAVPLLEAKVEDVQRVGMAAMLSQVTQVSSMLQILLATKQGAKTGLVQ